MVWLVHLWIVCVWTAVMAEALPALETQYSGVGESRSLECKGTNKSCQGVYWYRYRRAKEVFQFLFFYNNADKHYYGSEVNETKFKGSKRDSYVLRVIDVKMDDAGVYFCILRFIGENKLGSRGIDLKAGEKSPTQPPPTTTRKAHKQPKSCRCPGKTPSKQEFRCKPLFLWILGGVLGSLVTALISILFYFSRLPKKCHHRLAKNSS
ncbi:T-cell surface glycoprotein CD8 beta chain [Megalops cyprinoides]|uniref:T-cell surface glycoprotein CD8 beta chain n=1 Tax=Megalops cyprinoides TaxID=118141 RepID=UPI00186422FD|nr:T-cell surface glycoprotein CD8 beta chain [Megalops cyprinoides]